MDSLTNEQNYLSLSKKEGPGFLFINNYQSNKFVLTAKFMTKRALNVDADQNLQAIMAVSEWI